MSLLNIYYQNSRGLRTKTHIFYRNLCISNYDIIVLTETWLNNSVSNHELFDNRYNVYRRDRETTGFNCGINGGGVLVAVLKKFKSVRMSSWESDCEDVWVTLDFPAKNSSGRMAFCGVYLPSPVRNTVLEHFIGNCNRVTELSGLPLNIIGDFNFRRIYWNTLNLPYTKTNFSSLEKTLVDFIFMNNLKQYNKIENNQNRILDLVLTSKAECNVVACLDSLSKVDPIHPTIIISISALITNNLKINSDTLILNFRKADYELVNDFLEGQNWNQVLGDCGDVNIMLSEFNEVIKTAIDKFVPSRKQPSYRYPIWFNRELIKTLKDKETVRKRFKIFKNPLDDIRLKALGKLCDKLSFECYNSYIKHVEDMIGASVKGFWTFLKTKRQGKSCFPDSISDGALTVSDGAGICDLYAKYFSSVYSATTTINHLDHNQTVHIGRETLCSIDIEPKTIYKKLKTLDKTKGAGPDGVPALFVCNCASNLVYPLLCIFKRSLDTGIFPDLWKVAKVVPIPKDGDDSLVSNYRPISILSVFAKVFESIVCPIVQVHFKQIITPYQHGFVTGRSTCTNLTSFTESLVEAIDKQKQVDVIYTDFSKAFDRVSHDILILKLSNYGFGGPLLKWLQSYLCKRLFHVVLGGFCSEHLEINSGVPQGSLLGPILFNIYINDIVSCFPNSSPFLYADDLKFSRIIETDTDIMLLQNDLNNLIQWCHNNGMSLNGKKCFHIKFSRKINLKPSAYLILQEPVQEVDQIKDLGVILDRKLTFVPHIDHIVNKASRMLGFIIRNGKVFKKPATKILLYNSLVRSILEYNSVVWRPHFATHNLRIERVQKRFLWHLSWRTPLARRIVSYKNRLQHFGLFSLDNRRNLLDIQFLFKLLRNHIDCSQLVERIHYKAPSRYPRRMLPQLNVPFRRTVLGANSPIPRLCKLLNSHIELDINFDSLSRVRSGILGFDM